MNYDRLIFSKFVSFFVVLSRTIQIYFSSDHLLHFLFGEGFTWFYTVFQSSIPVEIYVENDHLNSLNITEAPKVSVGLH